MSTSTTELDKQHAVIDSGEADTLTRFYDWLNAQGYILGKWYESEDWSEDWNGYEHFIPFHVSPEKLFAEFFGIDLDKIESERRAILETIRSAQ